MADEAFFGGAASLVDHLDKEILVVLRDGKNIVGKLSSYDQFGSIVLEQSKERHVAKGKYADLPMGMYIVRGENIVMIGEIDQETHSNNPLLVEATWDEVRELEEEERKAFEAAMKEKKETNARITGTSLNFAFD